jgi:hypothetical protein
MALLAALVPLAGPAVAVGTFDDDDGNIHEANIEKIASLGITKGCNPPTNNLYCPDDLVTREQMASFLVRTFDLPSAPPGQFTDTSASVHAADIDALAASGVTKGCDPPANTNYCPTQHVTRGQMAAFMARGLDLANESEDFFGDDNGTVFELQINAIARIGITKGCNPPINTDYCPDRPVRRDEMASFLSRVADIITTGTTQTTTPTPTTGPSTTTTTSLPLPPGDPRGLFSGPAPDRQPAVRLQGATVQGSAYLFAGPDPGLSQTRFYLDDPTPGNPSGTPYRVEDISKFDLEGTAPDANANPFDTFKLKNGSRTLSAEMVLTSGSVEVYKATFTVNNPASVWLNKQGESFNLPPGGASGTPKTVQVASNNGAGINWTATKSAGAGWLTLVNSTGTSGQNVSFNASAAGLTPGVRKATVTVTAPGFEPRSFVVTMNVLAVGSCPSPSGGDVRVGLPFDLQFDSAIAGTVEDSSDAGTGFRCVQATKSGQGYIKNNLSLSPVGAGTLAIATTAGIADQTTDTQDNALGVGFVAGSTVTASTTFLSPKWDGNGGFEQAGVWIGIHEDSYVKGVILDNPGGMAVQLRSEAAPGTILGTQTVSLPAAQPQSVRLELTINDATNTATLSYSINGGAPQSLDSVPVTQGVFDGTDPDGAGANGPTLAGTTMAGILAGHRNGSAGTFVFGDFSVSN